MLKRLNLLGDPIARFTYRQEQAFLEAENGSDWIESAAEVLIPAGQY